MDLLIANLADRPDLPSTYGEGEDLWPRFMYEDPIGGAVLRRQPHGLPRIRDGRCGYGGARPDRSTSAVGPVHLGGYPDVDLPVDGWDGVIRRAALDRQLGRRGNLVSALEITIRPDLQGCGLSAIMLDTMRRNATKLGFESLVAPVRPTAKHRHPHMPIAEYAAWSRADGLPYDPWLRVHVRAGGRIVGVCHRAMVIPGTLAEWRSWTGLPFDTSGLVVVPDALVPVHCDTVHEHAAYVEPAVWVHHRLT